MTTASELRAAFTALAQRSVSIMGACANEESTRLYLVLPLLTALGYDVSNPYEVYPGHVVANEAGRHEVDFALLRSGEPVLAVEVLPCGTGLANGAGRLARYFDACPSVKLALLTDGIVFALFVDSLEAGRMDAEPFLTFDMETIAHAGLPDEVLEPMLAVTKLHFEPAMIAEAAHVMLVKKRLRGVFLAEAKAPSDALCRFALEHAGFATIAQSAIERYYRPLVHAAFEEALVAPVIASLATTGSQPGEATSRAARLDGEPGPHPLKNRVESAEQATQLLAYVRRRLAFLIDSEAQFAGLDEIAKKDYVGRTTYFYARERKGRLFDLVAAGDGVHKYIFPDPIGAIVTGNIRDIDEALKAVYEARVHELGAVALNFHRQQRRSA